MRGRKEMTEDKIAIKPKPPTFGGLKKGIAATREKNEQTIKTLNPLECQNRLAIVVDDSGSMGHSGMEAVHKGVREFTSSCNIGDTSITIYPLNANPRGLICDYDVINIYISTIWDTGGTPLYGTLAKLIETEEITRAIVFSDGSPTDFHLLLSDNIEAPKESYIKNQATAILDKYVTENIPIDTIYIGEDKDWSGKESSGYTEMKSIADYTGGTFCNFKDSKTLSTSLKYLAPKYRALLANEELKKRIEKGEQI